MYVRRMRREDVAQVVQIDREAFPTEWPPTNFARELENNLAYYIVVTEKKSLPPSSGPKPVSSVESQGFLARLKLIFNPVRVEPAPGNEEPILGYAGMWIMADEAHVMSIASCQRYRRRGVGEVLLIAIIDLAVRHKARIVTLEVRVSNTTAQNLYTKYGFQKTGLRKGYYLDNKEDAIIMTTEYIGTAVFQERLRKMKESHSRQWGPVYYDIEKPGSAK